MEKRPDSRELSLAGWLFVVALLSAILGGFVRELIQLVKHDTYWLGLIMGTGALAGAWWLTRGRHAWPAVPSDERLWAFGFGMATALSVSDATYRVVNAAFGAGTRTLETTVVEQRQWKSWWYVTVAMNDGHQAEIEVPRRIGERLRDKMAVKVVLHGGLFGDDWCSHDAVEIVNTGTAVDPDRKN